MPNSNTPSDSYGELRELSHEVTSAEVEVEEEESQQPRPAERRKKRNQ